MICSDLFKIIGVTCHPLTDDVAMIDTSFAFEDGDGVAVFVEKAGKQIRFFDDGKVILHFLGRGLTLDGKRAKFIKNIAEPHGVSLNSMGELEVWASEKEAPIAFAKFVSTIVGICSWERDHVGTATDTSLLVDEIGMYLRAWKPEANLVKDPEYRGISGFVYHLDYKMDGMGVVALTPHHSSVGAAVRKLLDIRSQPENQGLNFLAVIDDRYDLEAANREGLVIEALANVWTMTRLEKQVRLVTYPA